MESVTTHHGPDKRYHPRHRHQSLQSRARGSSHTAGFESSPRTPLKLPQGVESSRVEWDAKTSKCHETFCGIKKARKIA